MKLGSGLGKALKTLLLYGGWRFGGKNFYKNLKICMNSSGLERRGGGTGEAQRLLQKATNFLEFYWFMGSCVWVQQLLQKSINF